MLLLLIALLGLPSMVSATVDHLIVHPDSLANYEYTLKFENHTVSAVLANGTVIHDGQDPCTSRTSYKIGQEYHEADCPAPNKFVNSDGFCDVSRALVNGHPCEAFCQVLGSQLSVLSQYDYGDMNAVYKQGISGGWVNGFGFAIQMDPSTVRLNKNECGYWAFIIIKKKSW
ncbi:hypothetical protein PG990_000635 [Apiospora arundinis]|uniref:Ecp2 effector protein domain-containing protein n=1 Tax=Apiospora arundinis TaxID=335852 RepID=A0ABR2I011_9PEZI